MLKKYVPYIIILLIAPVIILAGAFLFPQKSYVAISFLLATLACIPFFISFENKNATTKRIVIIAVMTALSVAGRFIFAPIAFFKPITALVIITAVYLGKDAGFLTGALSAFISNFYFGQGPWTPFQMFAWGIIGFIAGILSNHILRYKVVMIIYAVLSGVLYSFILDIWSTMWIEGSLSLTRFIATTATSLPITAVYAISNVIFLFLLLKPIGKKLERIKTKYGL